MRDDDLWRAADRYYLTTASGVIRAIAAIEYHSDDSDLDRFGDLMRQALAIHRLA